MKYKYLVLDFGKVIAGPALGHWDITPKLIELIGNDNFDRAEFERIRKEYAHILSKKVLMLIKYCKAIIQKIVFIIIIILKP